MVGNILRFNNIYNRIVIASETGDNKQIYFLGGRLFYYILYFEPIEVASLDENSKEHASLTSILGLVNKIAAI